jgi:hypothetical protein
MAPRSPGGEAKVNGNPYSFSICTMMNSVFGACKVPGDSSQFEIVEIAEKGKPSISRKKSTNFRLMVF